MDNDPLHFIFALFFFIDVDTRHNLLILCITMMNNIESKNREIKRNS
jgi:hypothetical protein